MRDEDPATPAYRDTIVDGKAHADELADTRADVAVSEIEYQEGRPPLEHTARVRAKASEKGPVSATTNTKTSSELAGPSQRERRRERDRRAESAALKALFAVFLVAGVSVFLLLNSGLFDDAPPPERPVDPNVEVAKAKPKPPPVVSTKADETRNIPALASMSSEGLTIGAEGLPQVLPIGEDVPPGSVVGLEACRFAYGVWEFSPNNAFRFITTCKALAGQVLVGAYEIDARLGLVRLSPVRAGAAMITSTFEVERPSRMTSRVLIGSQELEVRQKITVIHPGMDGENFARGLGERNLLSVQGGPGADAPAPAPTKAPPAGERDPVLDLLQGE